MKKRRNHWYWVYWVKIWLWNYENAIDFRRSGVQNEGKEDFFN